MIKIPRTSFEIKNSLDNELQLCPGRWERLGNKLWYSEKEIEAILNEIKSLKSMLQRCNR